MGKLEPHLQLNISFVHCILLAKMKSLLTGIFGLCIIGFAYGGNTNDYREIIKRKNSKILIESGREEYSGIGDMKCYGEMEISLNKWGTGTANCRPITTTGAPQGYIADGEDGSHWVIVDDKGTADCYGDISYTTGDLGLNYCSFKNAQSIRKMSPRLLNSSPNPRMFCGYFTCTGNLNLVCDGMLAGCHGDA